MSPIEICVMYSSGSIRWMIDAFYLITVGNATAEDRLGRTSVEISVFSGCLGCFGLLCSLSGQELLEKQDFGGRSLLHQAAQGSVELWEAVVSVCHPRAITQPDNRGNTPPHIAAIFPQARTKIIRAAAILTEEEWLKLCRLKNI